MKLRSTSSSVFFLIVMLVASANVRAQSESDFVYNCPLGVYIATGSALGDAAHPSHSITGYRIERKEEGKGDWELLAEISSPASRNELDRRFSEALRSIAYEVPMASIDLSKVWSKLEAYHELDSLPGRGAFLSVRLACGAMFLDRDVRSGSSYEYRVYSLSADDAKVLLHSQRISIQKVIAPGEVYKASRIQADTNRCSMLWHKSDRSSPTGLYVYRKSGFGDFVPAGLHAHAVRINDTLFYSVVDTSVALGVRYSYYLQPFDYFGNQGPRSETLSAIALNPMEIRLPQKLRAEVDPQHSSVKLQWKFSPDPQSIGIRIYRSSDSSLHFRQIGEVSAGESSFVDAGITPDKTYYYCLRVVNAHGDESGQTAKVFAVTESKQRPLAPFAVSAMSTENGVLITWHAAGPSVRGFFVYRGEGIHAVLQRQSGLLQITDPAHYSYLDTDRSLSPMTVYSYAVRAMSVSNVEGGLSDTARVQPKGKTTPPVPTHLTATYTNGNKIKLFWDDVRINEATVIGFQVFRRAEGESEFTQLVKKAFSTRNNNFVDSTIAPVKRYEYYVRSFDAFGNTSPSSLGAEVIVPIVQAQPLSVPTALVAEPSADGIVLSWGSIIGEDLSGFKIYRREADGEAAPIASEPAKSTSYLDRSAKRNVTYWYSISTLIANKEEGALSKEVRIHY